MAVKTITLKSCPFCGGRVGFVENLWAEKIGIWCEHCDAVVKFGRLTDAKSIAIAWNRRDDDADAPD